MWIQSLSEELTNINTFRLHLLVVNQNLKAWCPEFLLILWLWRIRVASSKYRLIHLSCLHVCMCPHVCLLLLQFTGRFRSPRNGVKLVCATMRVLGTKPESLERATSAPKCWAIALAPQSSYFNLWKAISVCARFCLLFLPSYHSNFSTQIVFSFCFIFLIIITITL